MNAKPYAPTLRESVAVTSTSKRRLMMLAIDRHPGVPIQLAMWRCFVDGIDALEREASHEAEVRRVAAAALAAVTCSCLSACTCPVGAAR